MATAKTANDLCPLKELWALALEELDNIDTDMAVSLCDDMRLMKKEEHYLIARYLTAFIAILREEIIAVTEAESDSHDEMWAADTEVERLEALVEAAEAWAQVYAGI